MSLADSIDKKVDFVFQSLSNYAAITLRYSDGSGISHADLKAILYSQGEGPQLLDKGVALAQLLKVRQSYRDKTYMKASSSLNADLLWSAVGAPGVDPSVFKTLLDIARNRALAKATQYGDKSLPGLARAYESYGRAYGFYGKVAEPVVKYKAMQAVINGVAQRYGTVAANGIIERYITQVSDPNEDKEVWEDLCGTPGAGNPNTLQAWVNRNYPTETWYSTREACRSSWRLFQLFDATTSNGKTAIDNDLSAYVKVLKGRIKAVESNLLSISDANLVEGSRGYSQALFTLNLPKPSPISFSVIFSTHAETATNIVDFTPRFRSKINFPRGEKSVSFAIAVRGDRHEESDESFSVQIEKPVGVYLGRSLGQAIIKDDDYGGSVEISDLTIGEGNGKIKTARVSVSLSTPPLSTVVINYSTADKTAIAGSDYTPVSGSIKFLPSQVTQTIALPILGDTNIEPDEFLFLNFDTWLPGKKQCLICIKDDDSKSDPPLELNGKIAFLCRFAYYEKSRVAIVNADGTNCTYLTDGKEEAFLPVISPDGKKIAYLTADSSSSIASWLNIMNADGSSQKRLALCTSKQPANFSPDSKEIIFSSNIFPLNSDQLPHIYKVSADGSHLRRLTTSADIHSSPVFSPNGKSIAFIKDSVLLSDHSQSVWIMNKNGAGERVLDSQNYHWGALAFSPDGTRIFSTMRSKLDSSEDGIGVIDLNTSTVSTLPGNGWFGRHSPMENLVAYTSTTTPMRLTLLRTDGFKPIRVSSPSKDVVDFCFSPNGQQIAFTNGIPLAGSDQEIYLINSDGTSARPLFDNFLNAWSPSWGIGRVAASSPALKGLKSFQSS